VINDEQEEVAMSDSDRGQINRSAAEVYEEFFIAALFGEWADRVVDAARIQAGQRVLDVACGTGILARAAAKRVGASGLVVGLDINAGMLAVAARKAPQIEWRQGKAEALPSEDNRFDAVVSQFGLMFFEDRRAALQEMIRVLKPGGHLAVAVWASLDRSPGYAAMVDLLQRLFGEPAADALRAPFILGDIDELQALFSAAGIPNTTVTTPPGTAHFPSIQSWIFTDVKGWTLADMIDDAQYEMLLKEAEQVLAPFVTADGSVTFDAPAHIVTVVKA
jgi:ubiquinone/menaquinone biosynthesis C-methylase UbiE